MIKINNNFATFLGLSLLVSISVIAALQRFTSQALQESVTSCQTFVESLSIRLPHALLLLPILFVILILASVVIKFTITYVKVNLLKKKIIPNDSIQKNFALLLKKLKLENKTMLVHDEKPFAFCFGLSSPKIYISTATLTLATQKELRAVLYHERYHLQKKDTGIVLFISAVESLFPFFPLFSDFLKNYQIEQEIKADQETIREIGSSAPIISILKKLLAPPSTTFAYVPQLASRDTLEPRIKALVKKEFNFKKFTMTNMIISLLSMIFLTTAIYSPVQAVDIHNKQYDSVLLCLSGNECISACKGQDSQTPYSSNTYYPAVNASYSPSSGF